MTQIIEIEKIDSATLSNDLYMAFFEERLSKTMYDTIISELQTRAMHPDVLMSLVVLGLPEWQKKYL